MAFGEKVDGSTLQSRLRSYGFGNHQGAQEKLAQAVEQLLDAASRNKVELRGKYVNHFEDDDLDINTEKIDDLRLANFRKFDPYEDGLRRGLGLRRYIVETNHEILAEGEREDYLRGVSVSHDDLIRAFPPALVISKGAAERDCREWLIEAFAADPDKLTPMADYKRMALEKFRGRLSGNGFKRVWNPLSKETGRNRAGRKSKQ